jgi:hypothetical protein
LSGEANIYVYKKEKIYKFDYEQCHLSLLKTSDGKSISISDPDGACARYVCGQSGVIDGLKFSLPNKTRREMLWQTILAIHIRQRY